MSHIAQETLQAYLDGQLGEPNRQPVIDHLAGCMVCQARLEALQALYDRIESLPDQPLSVDLTPRVLASLTPPTGLSARARWLLLAELGLGAGALAVSLGWLSWSPAPWWSQFLAALDGWLDPRAAVLFADTLQAALGDGLAAFGSLSAGATAPLAGALPVTGWATVLGVLVLAGLAANGLMLVRAGQARPKRGSSA